MVSSIEYLHQNGVYHLDLKPENILLDERYSIKIGDFDRACKANDFGVLTTGTKNYRSPELRSEKCKNPKASDIYSLGVILFIMKTGGLLPCNEDNNNMSKLLRGWMSKKMNLFWDAHTKFLKESIDLFSESFKELFEGMI